VTSLQSSKIAEPINLREWVAPYGSRPVGRLFTCGRPGRATLGLAYVAVSVDIMDLWVSGLPRAEVLHIVSLLGWRKKGNSEFGYYPFRSCEEPGPGPTFEEWLNKRYSQRFIVHELPTADHQGIPPETLDRAKCQLLSLLEQRQTTIVIDSAGAERTVRVCEAIGWRLIK
jgi:hypothetical protein